MPDLLLLNSLLVLFRPRQNQLIASFREAYPFGPQGEALELAIDQCLEVCVPRFVHGSVALQSTDTVIPLLFQLEHARSGMGIQHISLETFVQWCMKVRGGITEMALKSAI